ncbi:multidrug transporter MatE [Sorangium cellulosum]|uniref:Multidrug transporter MatE n=1 Tax=Sorangium cellulosum TaxID=56 RepID=A0A4V0NCV2_SORCE|nr:MATE family efflux transporter [Sorangium cellulosum]AUX20462.1 multidrug transporter MatE [Sorangium cellulosum]
MPLSSPSRPLPLHDSAPSELRTLARLALPIALAQAGLVALSLVDVAIVGRVSVNELASCAMGRTIVHTSNALGVGIAAALDPLASQAIGAGRPGQAWAALRSTLKAGLLVSVVAFSAALAATAALAPMGVDPALVPGVRRYILGHALWIFLWPAFLAGKSFLQAHGATRPALLAVIAANAVNLVACNLLVRGDEALRWVGLPPLGLPQLGALGAGLAASVASVVLSSSVLWSARRRRAAAPEHPVPLATVYRLGVPIGLQLLAEVGVFGLAALLAGRFGAPVVSAHQIAIGLAAFTFMGALGVGGATAVRVGHAVGAGRSPLRAGVLGLLLGAALMGVSASVYASFPRPLLGAFTPDAEVIAIGVPLLRIAALFQLFDGVQAVAAGALRGAGDVRFPFWANLGAHWAFGLPLSIGLAFGLDLGVRGLWFGLTAGLVAVAVVLTTRFVRLARAPIARTLPRSG